MYQSSDGEKVLKLYDKVLVGTAAVLLLLALARLLDLPVALAIVAGRSMEPTLRPGDMVVLAKGDIEPGDIVLWCTGPTSCTIHRLINLSRGVAVTKGDANPAPDPPIPAQLIKYRAVFVVPRELVAVVAVAAAIPWLYRRLPELARVELPIETVAFITLGTYLLIVYTAPLLAPQPPPVFTAIQGLMPRIWLEKLHLTPNGTIIIAYGVERTWPVEVVDCTVDAPELNATAECMARLRALTVLVNVPREFYNMLYMQGWSMMWLHLTVELTNATLEARYPVHIAWRPVKMVVKNCILVIANPNPADTIAIVTLANPPLNKTTLRVKASAASEIEIPLKGYRYIVVRVLEAGERESTYATHVNC